MLCSIVYGKDAAVHEVPLAGCFSSGERIARRSVFGDVKQARCPAAAATLPKSSARTGWRLLSSFLLTHRCSHFIYFVLLLAHPSSTMVAPTVNLNSGREVSFRQLQWGDGARGLIAPYVPCRCLSLASASGRSTTRPAPTPSTTPSRLAIAFSTELSVSFRVEYGPDTRGFH